MATEQNYENTADMILSLRKAAGLTQGQLALAAGVHQATISAFEMGQRLPVAAASIHGLAKALKISRADLEAQIARDRGASAAGQGQ